MDTDEFAPLRLSRAQFYRWAALQPSGKFERVFGEVVQLAPERWRHNQLKKIICRLLEDAATADDLQVGIDGMTVAAGGHDFEPDVFVHQGPPISPDAVVVPNPIIIFEVLSPATARVDVTIKLEAYFELPQMQHYVVVRSDRRVVTHYRRGSELPSHPAITTLVLNPPGIAIDLADIYDRAGVA